MSRPTLSYSAPRVLFRGDYVFRSLSVGAGIPLSLLASAILAAAAVYGSSLWWNLPLYMNVMFALMALGLASKGLYGLWGWVRNDHIRIEINEDGIIRGNRLWSWDRLERFAGTRHGNSVVLGFSPRGRVLARCDLPTTPLLTEEQYVELAREVSRCISGRFPHVDVAMKPLEPPSGG